MPRSSDGSNSSNASSLGAGCCAEDWGVDPEFFLAVLALLSGVNACEREYVDNTKINASRARKGGLPLLSYYVCKIAPHVRKVIARRRNGVSDGEGVREHFVRGHFKLRNGRTFWWKGHFRGDKSLGVVEKDYLVEGADAA
jgi:hypothetical protein